VWIFDESNVRDASNQARRRTCAEADEVAHLDTCGHEVRLVVDDGRDTDAAIGERASIRRDEPVARGTGTDQLVPKFERAEASARGDDDLAALKGIALAGCDRRLVGDTNVVTERRRREGRIRVDRAVDRGSDATSGDGRGFPDG